ncbi:hypothetical protein [Bradyrhizobium sp. JYMT SZCCT0428]|uniref:hypothetical protein n=1 Tax=Bradyrhizobium sp. JYMT SZCCT0428 TaxID=2807673 RepID=UPI001BA6156F|nr:hypothetical protein [Bradyrhizobium sp. JYMT SZCCT0428]MBR1157302.1 hypothetical protein [Bradyrhizobium sp. JYMT SZCCT0428]
MKRRTSSRLPVAWPSRCLLAARAQQPGGVRRIGVLMHLVANDLEGQARFTAFTQAMAQLGWTDGRNVRIDARWGANDADRRKYAEELVALAPDVILVSATVEAVGWLPGGVEVIIARWKAQKPRMRGIGFLASPRPLLPRLFLR